jgi:hypothetical protein
MDTMTDRLDSGSLTQTNRIRQVGLLPTLFGVYSENEILPQ